MIHLIALLLFPQAARVLIAYNKLSEIYSLREIAALLGGAAPTGPHDRSCDPRAIEALTATFAALLGLTEALMNLGCDDDIAAASAVLDAKGLRLLAKIAHWLQRPLKPVLLQQMGEAGSPGWGGGYVWYLATVTLWRLIGPLVEKDEKRLCTAACVQVQASGRTRGRGWEGGNRCGVERSGGGGVGGGRWEMGGGRGAVRRWETGGERGGGDKGGGGREDNGSGSGKGEVGVGREVGDWRVWKRGRSGGGGQIRGRWARK